MGSLKDSLSQEMHEIYESRNILRSLVTKNLFGRYHNSFLGFAWNFITPVITMLMYYIIFTEIRGDGSIENKWVFLATAIFMFTFLTHCITGGAGVFTDNAGMIKKMYFPREILVFANAISAMIVCIIGYVIVLFSLIIAQYPVNWACTIFIPVLLLFAFVFGIGCMFLLSSLAVFVRDIKYALGSMGIALFVMTPMRYMASSATGIRATLIWYNPLTYFVESIHEILYFGEFPNLYYVFMCMIISVAMLIIGYSVFWRLRHGFVKRI